MSYPYPIPSGTPTPQPDNYFYVGNVCCGNGMSKDVDASVKVYFDYTTELPAGVTLLSLSLTVDPIASAGTLFVSAVTIAAGVATFMVTGGAIDGHYNIEGIAHLSNSEVWVDSLKVSVTDCDANFTGNPGVPGPNTTTAYMIGGFVPGILGANQYVLLHILGMAVTFPANFDVAASGGPSFAASQVNSTAAVALVISQCPATSDPTISGSFIPVGTITFAAGGHIGTYASASPTQLLPGDYLAVVAPGTADPTLAGVTITLSGNRT